MPDQIGERWLAYFSNISSINIYASIIAIGTIIVILIIRRSHPRIPAQFSAVILACVAIYLFHLPVETIGSRFGGIPSELPQFHLPLISLGVFKAVLPEAITIAILAAIESLLCAVVADGMTGQDSVNSAKAFHDRLGITGIVLTKMDGDARGGAALSIKELTGKPVKFLGMGETLDKLEEFRPEGLASRILGFGDVDGLMQDFERVVDEKKAEEDAMRKFAEWGVDSIITNKPDVCVKVLKEMGKH